jgi:hypothetical protein
MSDQKFTPLVQYGTLFHDSERFCFQLVDGSSWSNENWYLMANTYGDELVKRWNAYDDLTKQRDALVKALELVLPRIAHRADCISINPSEEWAENGSISYDGCNCEIQTVRAALAQVKGE